MKFVKFEIIWILFITTECALRKCPKLTLQNGHVDIGFRGRIAKFSCDLNFSLIGYNTSVCIGEKWSHQLPKCVRVTSEGTTTEKSLIDTTRMANQTNNTTRMANQTNNTNITNVSQSTMTTAVTMETTTISTKQESDKTTTISPITTTTNILRMNNSIIQKSTFTHPPARTTKKRKHKRIHWGTTKITDLDKNTRETPKVNHKMYIIIGISCTLTVGVVVIIIFVCYKKWFKFNQASNDQIRLVSKNGADGNEEWSLLT